MRSSYEKFKDKINIIPRFFQKNYARPCYSHFPNSSTINENSQLPNQSLCLPLLYYGFQNSHQCQYWYWRKIEKKIAWNIPHHRSIWISLSILQCSFNVCSNIEIENKNLRIEFFLCVQFFFSWNQMKWYQWPEPVEQIISCQSLIYYKRLRSLLFSRSSFKIPFDTTETSVMWW